MITCARCSKENQDHYKFCLGCGAKLEGGAAAKPAAAPAPAPTAAPAPATAPVGAAAGFVDGGGFGAAPATAAGQGPGAPGALAGAAAPAPAAFVPAFGVSAPVTAPLPAGAGAEPSPDTVPCPKCGRAVVASHTFCGSCGYRMKPAPAPAGNNAAPAAVQRTMFMAPQPSKATPRGHLTLIRPDGSEGGVHPLHEGENLIGRGQGALFDADPYLSPRHAEFVLNDDGLAVQDLRSLNGVFVKIGAEERLESGDIFRIGQELLRFDVIAPPQPLEDGTEVIGTPNPGYWGRISVIVGRDVDGPAFPLFDESVVLGRERGDILFPEDGYVSGTHAQITLRDGQVYLSDLGSSNGTFFRIRGQRAVPAGSLLLMGQQLFRVAFR